MQVVVGPEGSPERQQASSASAIATDLERLTADLDRFSRRDDAGLTVAVEDARHALSRAVIAVREVLATAMTAADPFATVTLT